MIHGTTIHIVLGFYYDVTIDRLQHTHTLKKNCEISFFVGLCRHW